VVAARSGASLGRGRGDGGRHGDAASPQHGEQRDAELGAVGQRDRDPITGDEPGLEKLYRVSVHRCLNLRPVAGPPGGRVDQGGMPRHPRRRVGHEVGNVAGQRVDHGKPFL